MASGMISWRRSLKSFLPAPLAVILSLSWAVLGHDVLEWVRAQVVPGALISIAEDGQFCCLVKVKITPRAEEMFKKLAVQITLEGTAGLADGYVSYLSGDSLPLKLRPLKNPPGVYTESVLKERKELAISLRQREWVQIRLRVPSQRTIKEIYVTSENQSSISSLDLGQRLDLHSLVESVGRAPWAVALILLFVSFREPVLRLTCPGRVRQLAADTDLLWGCYREVPSYLATFDKRYQIVISDYIDKYLAPIDTTIRDTFKTILVKYEIFKRATTFPKFGGILEVQIKLFVMDFCVGYMREIYEGGLQAAKAEKAQIT